MGSNSAPRYDLGLQITRKICMRHLTVIMEPSLYAQVSLWEEKQHGANPLRRSRPLYAQVSLWEEKQWWSSCTVPVTHP